MESGYEEHLRRTRERGALLKGKCAKLFCNVELISLEIGCGHGHFLTAYAEENREKFCVGIDLKSRRLEKADRKKRRRSLDNLLFLKAEAMEFLAALPADTRVEDTFLLFSDPWPKKRHHKNRVVKRVFLDRLAKKMNAGGQLYFRTDFEPYYEWTSDLIGKHPLWDPDNQSSWPIHESSYFQELVGEYQSLVARRNSPAFLLAQHSRNRNRKRDHGLQLIGTDGRKDFPRIREDPG